MEMLQPRLQNSDALQRIETAGALIGEFHCMALESSAVLFLVQQPYFFIYRAHPRRVLQLQASCLKKLPRLSRRDSAILRF
jgi:hypothetical protein